MGSRHHYVSGSVNALTKSIHFIGCDWETTTIKGNNQDFMVLQASFCAENLKFETFNRIFKPEQVERLELTRCSFEDYFVAVSGIASYDHRIQHLLVEECISKNNRYGFINIQKNKVDWATIQNN